MRANEDNTESNERKSSIDRDVLHVQRRRYLQLTGLLAAPTVATGGVTAETATSEYGYGVVEYGVGSYGSPTDSTDSLSVRSLEADEITETSVVLNGELNELDGVDSATVFFEYRTSGADEWNESATEDVDSTGQFSVTVDELEPGTEYEYRAVALSDELRETGSVATFTTFTPPSVVTREAVETTHEDATLEGEITNLGDSSSVSTAFQYRSLESEEWGQTSWSSHTGTGTFSETITGLKADTTYEYRSVVEGDLETRDAGDVETVTTDDFGLRVSTGDASETTETSAVLSGTLDEIYGASSADLAFEYRRVGEDDWQSTDEQEVAKGETATESIEALDPETTYEFRVIGTLDEERETGETVEFDTEAEDEAETDPEIERFVTWEDSPPNPHADVHVDWIVQDDGDLDRITIEIAEPDGSITEHSESVSGTTDADTSEIRVSHAAGEQLTVTVTVWNEQGRYVSESETLST